MYAGQVAVTDIQSSSTAWLLIQALVDAYGEDGAEETLAAIYDNCGAHIETSGSGPLKLCRAGEVAIGFGLRHQAVADKADGLPIDYVDPTEGNSPSPSQWPSWTRGRTPIPWPWRWPSASLKTAVPN